MYILFSNDKLNRLAAALRALFLIFAERGWHAKGNDFRFFLRARRARWMRIKQHTFIKG